MSRKRLERGWVVSKVKIVSLLYSVTHLISFSDGLARAEASRAPYAALISLFCSCGIYHRLYVGVIPDDDVDLCSWCGVDISAYSSQLAILQSPSPQMVRPK
ncbi:hypothetical protein AAHA92_27897 [Salvia divinorum]|uniref:Uncharacterized protein n=1 Tax=Salvia divinorum TaxID=28513 RepID=A0ABD1G860_SALDI